MSRPSTIGLWSSTRGRRFHLAFKRKFLLSSFREHFREKLLFALFNLINYLLYVLDKKDKYFVRKFSRKYENKKIRFQHWSTGLALFIPRWAARWRAWWGGAGRGVVPAGQLGGWGRGGGIQTGLSNWWSHEIFQLQYDLILKWLCVGPAKMFSHMVLILLYMWPVKKVCC